MKRGEMKRKTELVRKTALKRTGAALARSQGLGRGKGHMKGSGAQIARKQPAGKVRIPDAVREAVWKREHGRCTRCREKVTRGLFGHALHHVLAERLWPEHSLSVANLILICPTCHANHEHGARDDARLSMADDFPDETLTWLGEVADGPVLNHLDRTYRL